MAAEYEVNISLNTKKIDGQLNTLEKRLSDISKAADLSGSGPTETQRSKNLDRIRATGVIINRLGRELNKLEAQGVKVQNERSRIKRAVAKLDKGLVETARAHVVEIRDFIKEANKGLKTKEKTVKLDSVQNKFSERRLRALARSNERNEKDLRLNQRLTGEARARMRLLSQSGAKGFDATRPQGRQMADDIDARLKAQEKSARLANRINELEVKGVNVAKHRKQLGKIRTAQANRNFGLAEREIRVLRKSLELEQSKLRIEQSRLRILREQQKGFAASPVRGTPTMMGSPAQIAAAGRQAADPIRGRANLVGSPAYYEHQRKELEQAARRGGPVSPVKGAANLVGSPAYYQAQAKAISKLARQGGPADPIKGHPNLVGSPAYFDAQRKATERLARQGGAASPVRGNKNLVGSPAYYEAQQKANDRLGRQGGARSPLKGSKDLPGSPAYFDHLNREISKLARQGGARSPVRGNKDLIGSPAYYEHQRKELERLARKGGPRSPVRGGVSFPGSPKALEAAAKSKALEEAANAKALEEAAKGVAAVQKTGMHLMRLAGTAGRLAGRTARVIDSSNLRQRNAATLPSSEMLQARAKKTGQDIVQLKTDEAKLQERIAQALERSAQRSADVRRETERTVTALKGESAAMPFDDSYGPQLPSSTSAPLTGMTGGFGGSRFGTFGKATKKRIGDVALGAGFPLLFGGGPGAVIGGALGGLTGGGLAAQIALSAIGQQIDALVQRAAAVGSAFNELTFDLGTVASATGTANTETQAQLEKIEQYGSAAQAAKLATELLASRVGGKGRDALQKFGEDAVKLGNNLNIIFTQILSSIAKVAGPLLDKLAKFVGDFGARGAFKRAEGLTGVEAVVQKFMQSRQTITDVRKLRKDLRAAEFTGDLPAESTVSARNFARNFITKAGREMLEVPELKIEQIAAGIQTPDELTAANKVEKDEAAVAAALRKAEQRLKILKEETSLGKELLKLDFSRAAEIEKIDKFEFASKENREAAINATKQLFEAEKGERIGQALAEDMVKFVKLKEAQDDTMRSLDDQKRLLEGKLKGNEKEVRLQLEVEDIMRRVKGLNKDDVEAAVRKNAELEEQVSQVERLEDLYRQVGAAVESALVNGIMEAISSAKDLQSIVSGLFRDVGRMLLQFGVRTALNSINPTVFPLKMAQGGYVSSPTRALVGEGGQGEYVIPESKMRESMSRYARGARGSSVIPETGSSGTSGEGGGTAVAAPIDVRYTVERINSVDYVTADQFQRGLQSAAAQGAKQGEQQTLKRLQLSGSTRKRIGL